LTRFLVVGVHQGFDALVVAATEGVAVCVPVWLGDVWMLVLVTVFDVGLAVVLEVLSGSFYAVVKALTLDLVVLGRGLLPSFVVMVVIVGGLGVLGKH
jgi:hypothetical protein